MADIPAGTGLGSSGSFTTALLKALHAFRKNLVHPSGLLPEKQMATYEVKQRFFEIGSRAGLAELDSLLRDKQATFFP